MTMMGMRMGMGMGMGMRDKVPVVVVRLLVLVCSTVAAVVCMSLMKGRVEGWESGRMQRGKLTTGRHRQVQNAK